MKIETTAEELADLAARLRIGTTPEPTDTTALEVLRQDVEALTNTLAEVRTVEGSLRDAMHAHAERASRHRQEWWGARLNGQVTDDEWRGVQNLPVEQDPGPYPPPPWVRSWCARRPEPEPPSVRLTLDASGLGEGLQGAEESARALVGAPRIVLDDASTIDESGGLDPDHPVNLATTREEAWAELQRRRATRAAEHAQRLEESARQLEILADPVPIGDVVRDLTDLPPAREQIKPVTDDELAERDALEAAATAIDYAERAANHEEEQARRAQVRAEETARAEAGEPTPRRRGRAQAKPLPKRIGDPGADVGDGLDIWRVDGRALQLRARRAAVAAGQSKEEAGSTPAYTLADYARLAERLEEIRADGRITDPRGALAAILGRPNGSAINAILTRAVELGILGGGRAVGTEGRPLPHRMTDYAREVLAETATAAEAGPDDEETAPAPAAPLAPTPEQQAQIDRLHAENEAHVARTRTNGGSYRGPVATLPLRVNPVTNRYLHKDLRRAAGWARANGWAIGTGKSGHVEWYGPRGQRVTTAATPSTQGSVLQALRSLREAGVKA